MNAYRVMFESGPHKPAVEVTGLRLRICEIVQDYDEKVQGLVQDYDDKVKRLEAEKTVLKENAVKAVKDFERAERLVKYYEGGKS